ncbi:ABC transporter permease [Nocardiopsis sp. HNM0947]|uniref:ABC transporter permease n=1 Tax=Nocardiopsis coralli TaxID=2772213 RepID=A0ABR9P3I9_9ACTN|nr:ABC transporter permease [Nocardiopsis coralli]MBE2998416.1 ABC transporter permease [Nocardiopsis coralli]
MLRAILRDLREHKVRVAMTLAAIALGACAVVASWVVSDSTIATLAAGTESREGVDAAAWRGDEGILSEADREALEDMEGVASARSVTAFRAGLIGPDGDLVGSTTPLDMTGTGWDDSGRFSLVEGRSPRAPEEIAVDRVTAEQAGIAVGEDTGVLLDGGHIAEVTVVGAFDYRTLGEHDADDAWVDPRPDVVFDARSAQEHTPGFARVELAAASGADPEQVSRDAESVVAGASAASATTLAEVSDEGQRDAARELRLSLLPFAGIAMLVGVFVISNTFRLLVTQRTRHFALLRAVGARRAQVRATVVVEALVLGAVGAVLGSALGAVLGPAVLTVLRPGEELVFAVSPVALFAGGLAAIVTTVAAAYGAARRAGSVAPMAALREGTGEPGGVRRGRHLLGAVLLLAGVAAVLATSSPSEAAASRIIGLAGAAVSAVGVLLLTPAFTRAALGLVSGVVRNGAGPATRLGLRNAARDPRRAASTVGAVTVGLALVCAIATLSATFASLIASTTEANVPESTTVVEPAAGDRGALVPAAEDPVLESTDVAEIAALSEVGTAMAGSDAMARIDHPGGSTRRVVSAVDPEGLGTALTPHMLEGEADLDRGVIMAETQADMLGLGVGDRLTLGIEGVDLETRVAGLYEATEMSASVFFDVADAPHELADRVNRVHVTGPDPQAARAAVEEAVGDRPDVMVSDRDALIERDVERQQAGFMVMNAMFGLVILVAVFGVVNTLVLSVRERGREIGMLRAVGARRRTVHRVIRVESLALCVFGGLLGIVLGVGVGAVMQNAMLGQSLWTPTVPVPVIATAAAGTVALGVIAAVWPAGVAARTDPLEAITAE